MRSRPRLAFVERPSPNFNERNGESVQFLILHYTAMDTAEAAVKRLCDPASGVSSHYVVAEDGTIYRLVAEDKRAWHAGVSYWDGHNNLNSSTVGIEIANQGDRPFPRAQMDAVIALSRDIVNRHKIRSQYVIGHSDIAPDRKQDPGEYFDWKLLSVNGLGVWPTPTKGDYATSAGWGTKEVQDGLVKLGYRPTLDQTTLLIAFQRHFRQEVFFNGLKSGTADGESKARLACLIRRKNIADGLRRKTNTPKPKNKNKSKGKGKSKR